MAFFKKKNKNKQEALEEIIQKSSSKTLKTLFELFSANNIGQRIGCTLSGQSQVKQILADSLYPIPDQEPRVVGSFYESIPTPIPKLTIDNQRPRLLSINVGSFGLDSRNTNRDPKYFELSSKLIQFIKENTKKALIFNLLDCPDESEVFQKITEEGFEVYFFENIFYQESHFDRPNTGTAVIINKALFAYGAELMDVSMSLHSDGFIDISKSFAKFQTKDFLIQPLSVYFTLKNKQKKEIYLFASTYVLAFSTKKDRKLNLNRSLNILNQMKRALEHTLPDCKVITRFTGDFNFYGYDTRYGLFGLSAEPFSHFPALISGLILGFKPWKHSQNKVLFEEGRNIPNLLELQNVEKLAEGKGFSLLKNSKEVFETTKTIEVTDFIPKPIKTFFKGSKVSWSLDHCFAPKDKKVSMSFEDEPFGDFDHKTLSVGI
jgi:hypothetical protein